ncbi:MAG: hypothetical protein IT357_06450 [Gemmatimonadaceae bacterium]|nr:hypothetical protein [Gemmatimonadaceae bacterium]
MLPIILPDGKAAHAQQRSARPVLVQGARTDIVISVPARADAESAARRLATLVAGCRRNLTVAPTDSAAFVTAQPEPWQSPAATASTVVWLSVLPPEGLQADCGDTETLTGLAASRGLRVSFDTTVAPDRDLQRVVLKRGDIEITPIETQRLLIRRLGVTGFGTPRAGWFRVAIDVAEFAPNAAGTRDDISLEVYSLGGTDPDRVRLPWTALREAWESLYGERAAVARGQATAPMRLPAPGDEALHAAHEAYTNGDLRAAVRLAAPRLQSSNLTAADARQGRVQTGLALAALGDTAAARAALGKLVERDPCFTLDPAAPPAARALVDGLARPQERCRAQSVLSTALRAAALPGFGRPARGAGIVQGGLIAGLVVGGAGLAVTSKSTARDEYAKYVAYQDVVTNEPERGAADLYNNAESLRKRGQLAWTVAGAAWGAQLIYAIWSERRHAMRLTQVQQYGRESRTAALELRPQISASTLGLSLSLAW